MKKQGNIFKNRNRIRKNRKQSVENSNTLMQELKTAIHISKKSHLMSYFSSQTC